MRSVPATGFCTYSAVSVRHLHINLSPSGILKLPLPANMVRNGQAALKWQRKSWQCMPQNRVKMAAAFHHMVPGVHMWRKQSRKGALLHSIKQFNIEVYTGIWCTQVDLLSNIQYLDTFLCQSAALK